MGRPSKFKPEFVGVARGMCRLGATDIEVADAIGIFISTLYRWKAENKPFCDALKAGKKESDDRVVSSLYSSAVGYERDEVDIRVVMNEIVETKVRKFYPPVPTSAIFWLKNRRPEEWREKVDHTLGNPDGSALNLKVEFVRPA